MNDRPATAHCRVSCVPGARGSFPGLVALLCGGDAAADGGVSALGAIGVPFYTLVLLSCGIALAAVLLIRRKHPHNWTWLLLPLFAVLAGGVIFLIFIGMLAFLGSF